MDMRNWPPYPVPKLADMDDESIRIHLFKFAIRSATITLDTYARLWPERLDEVADAVGRARETELSETD